MAETLRDKLCDALVVGAGPVGLTLALELARLGLRCRIVDRAPTPTDKSKALVLWARSLELLENAGVARRFVDAGMEVKAASIYGDGRRLVHVPIERADTAYPRPLMLPQSETERLLGECLQERGVTVERPVELTELAEVDGHVRATLVRGDGSEEQLSAPWLIGCDGAHSTVRKWLGMRFTGEAEPNDWVLADVQLVGPIAHDEISIYWHDDGVLIFFPFARDRFRVVADLGKAQSAGKPADPTLEDAQAIVNGRGPSGVRLFDPVWLAGFRINERKVSRYSAGRVFLAGDAAHIHSPAGGQGMNTGMQDAFNLAWKLASVHHGRAPASLLDSYSIERSAIGDMVLRNAGLLTRVATVQNPFLQFVRNRVLALVGRTETMHEKLIANLTEVAVHYADTPLNGDEPGGVWSGRVKPGDRLPDAEVVDLANGRTVRLYETLAGRGWTLLLLPASQRDETAMRGEAEKLRAELEGAVDVFVVAPPASQYATADGANLGSEITTLVDASGLVRQRLGVRGSAMAMIRPDKYVAMRCHAGAWSALRSHLGQFVIANRDAAASLSN